MAVVWESLIAEERLEDWIGKECRRGYSRRKVISAKVEALMSVETCSLPPCLELRYID